MQHLAIKKDLEDTFIMIIHSRFYAREHGANPSALCAADKLAVALTPAWLYLPMAWVTGELQEYMTRAADGASKYKSMGVASPGARLWLTGVQAYVRRWAYEHKGGKPDKWTPPRRGECEGKSFLESPRCTCELPEGTT